LLEVYALHLASIPGDIWNGGEKTLAGTDKPYLE